MARKKREGSAPGPPPVAGWMATYGDMVTNMLCFFVLMMAMSSTDEAKVKAVADALEAFFKGSSGIFKDNQGILPINPPSKPNEGDGEGKNKDDNQGEASSPTDIIGQIISQIEENAQIIDRLQAGGILDQAEVKSTERGVIVRLTDSIHFESGSANLLPAAKEVLDQLIPSLKEIDNLLMIEGHTCDLPINTYEFPDNWELSSARALAVLRYLESSGVEPERLYATGLSQYKNIVPNTSEANRQRNRRVDIVIMNNRSVITTTDR